jgi:hypothetical protein
MADIFLDVDPHLSEIKLPDSTDSNQSGEQINKWIENCLKYHHECKKPNPRRPAFPSRLLAVQSETIKVISVSFIIVFNDKIQDTLHRQGTDDSFLKESQYGGPLSFC